MKLDLENLHGGIHLIIFTDKKNRFGEHQAKLSKTLSTVCKGGVGEERERESFPSPTNTTCKKKTDGDKHEVSNILGSQKTLSLAHTRKSENPISHTF